MTKNQRYEQKMKSQGLVKRTVWIPESQEIEIKQMIEFMIKNPGHIPAQVRNIKTGRFKKID
ncbi:hypothetical protein CWB99_03025 [Pseudoalteromonas rubra]|uniref:Uncharacterized protein n=1 Tax=Pseudoalteromonas rubra TaxID=43658 RepID=A0A5S3WUJ3_9GAMM|nr:hypothetical protein CWC00_17460 [Pseudoalteromonas rubra]TMP32030.1 hypothetical protein CWB99_03025 [Pseudoalteromonas rubra]